jgi:hypothetical protein
MEEKLEFIKLKKIKKGGLVFYCFEIKFTGGGFTQVFQEGEFPGITVYHLSEMAFALSEELKYRNKEYAKKSEQAGSGAGVQGSGGQE